MAQQAVDLPERETTPMAQQAVGSPERETLFKTEDAELYIIHEWCPDYERELMELPLVEYPKCSRGALRRSVGFFSDEVKGYWYSGQEAKAKPLTPLLRELQAKANKTLGISSYNGVLVNRYATGDDYISAHSDAEHDLDPETGAVAGVAFGAPRDCIICDKNTGAIVCKFVWPPRALVVMAGRKFQQKYTHALPKRKKVRRSRISLTVRAHRSAHRSGSLRS